MSHAQCPDNLACDGSICVAVSASRGACRTQANCPDGEICSASTGLCVPAHGENEACLVNSECKAALMCSPLPPSFASVCHYPSGPDGPCANVVDCEPGLYCTSNKCAAKGKHGEACRPLDLSACAPGLYCMSNNQCLPPGGEDEPCSAFSDIDHITCKPGWTCALETKTCVKPRSQGAPCNPAWRDTTCALGSIANASTILDAVASAAPLLQSPMRGPAGNRGAL